MRRSCSCVWGPAELAIEGEWLVWPVSRPRNWLVIPLDALRARPTMGSTARHPRSDFEEVGVGPAWVLIPGATLPAEWLRRRPPAPRVPAASLSWDHVMSED